MDELITYEEGNDKEEIMLRLQDVFLQWRSIYAFQFSLIC